MSVLEPYTMQIRVRLLIITLLAVASCSATLIAQQPGTVDIRPRLVTAQPGVPNVRVNVDRNRVPLGDEVTFTVAPESESVVTDPRFTVTIYFGDKKSERLGQTPVPHLYTEPRTFTYRVKVERLPLPSVKLITSPTTVAANSPVSFIAQLSRSYPNLQYQFVFDDGAKTKWQDAAQTSHLYAAAGTYLAFVDIGERSGGLTTRSGGSPRQRIQVTNAPTNTSAPPRGNTNTSKPANTNTSKPANTNTTRPASNNTTRPASNNTTRPASNNTTTPTNTNTPTLTNTNTSRPTNTNTSTPTNSNTSTSTSTNTSTPPNTNNNTSTTTTTNTPRSPPCVGEGCDGSRPWWILLLIALLLIYLAYKAVTFFLLPRPKLVPHLDPGVSGVGADKPLSIDLQLALDPNITGGQYGLDTPAGSLIKSERGGNG